jgi:hypothetical protein
MENETMSDHHDTNDTYQLGGRSGKGFMPGQSGNPAGRPKKPTLKETIERLLQEELPGKGMTKLEAVAHIWINEAMVKRDPRALSALINRLYPQPRLRAIEAEDMQPQYEVKLIEFVTYKDGTGQDYYREMDFDELHTRSDEFQASDRYRRERAQNNSSTTFDNDTT